jgi:small subunit ribosomal protein S20
LPNIKSAWKQLRASKRKNAYNKPIRTIAKTYVKKAEEVISSGDAESTNEAIRLAVKALDKGAQKGVIHKNNAARRKSRLIKKYNKATKKTSE